MSFIEHPFSGSVAGFPCIPGRVGFPLDGGPNPHSRGYLESALETFGIEADEGERAVMTGVWPLYEPGMDLLRDADLDGIDPELQPDLSQPPRR